MTTKANKTLDYLRRNIRTKHKGIRQTAYQTLVRSQVEYAPPPPPYGVLTPIKTLIRSKLSSAGQHDYSSYSSVTQMINILGWRSLEQRRADARLIMFCKIVQGLVEIPLPSYIHRQVRMTRTTHPYNFIQIQTTANYYKKRYK